MRDRLVRARTSEDGFGITELVIAFGVILTAIVALLHTVTNGFIDIGFARQRQAANGLATELIEQARGIAYAEIEAGLHTANAAADTTNIVSCSGVYRYKACSGAAPVGEEIVHSTRPATLVPLNPHRVDNVVVESTSLDRAVYVTKASAPADAFRLIVAVTWDTPMRGGAQPRIETHTIVFSPDGCSSTVTHPFSAPCQPFLYGTASAPSASLEVDGTTGSNTLPQSTIRTPSARADVQDEQIARSVATSDVSTLRVGDEVSGGLSHATSADTDIATATPDTYDAIPGASQDVGGLSRPPVTLTAAPSSGDTPSLVSAGAASTTEQCPTTPFPPGVTAAENDQRPCSSSRVAQASSLSSDLDLGTPYGTMRLGEMGAGAEPLHAFVDRDADATPANAGTMTAAASRSLGTIRIGGLPSGVMQPSGWNGFLVELTGYSDSVTAVAGTGSTAPTASVTPGTITYWNNGVYQTMPVPTATSAVPFSFAPIDGPAGNPYQLTISGSIVAGGSNLEVTSAPEAETTRTAARRSVLPPLVGTLHFVMTQGAGTVDPTRDGCPADGACIADLDVAVDLGTLVANAAYQAAPSA